MNQYNPARGGHAPSHLRGAFGEWIDQDGLLVYQTNSDGQPYYVGEEGDVLLLHEVIGKLWNCTDILASAGCVALEIPLGSTYARGVRRAQLALKKGALKFCDIDCS